VTNGVTRTRPKITGYARFNGVGGFNSNYPSRMIGRVFECAEPCVWSGQNKVLFKRVVPAPERPDYFLIAVRTAEVGHLEPIERLHIVLQRTGSDSAVQGNRQAGRLSGDPVQAELLKQDGAGQD